MGLFQELVERRVARDKARRRALEAACETAEGRRRVEADAAAGGPHASGPAHSRAAEAEAELEGAAAAAAANGGAARERPLLKFASPMVRYSKLAFRLLCRQYDCDLCFTPMIIAVPFNRSQSARDSDFTTTPEDRPLMVQFAARDPTELALAAQRCEGYVDGVDINCGCPQSWAIQEGIGAALIREPVLVSEMIREAKRVSVLPVSCKIRIQIDLRKTLEMVRMVEEAGVEWITVHGRTVAEGRKAGVHYDAIAEVKKHARVPVVANGDLFTPADIERVAADTNADGVLCARGLLSNPALFAGYKAPPLACFAQYLDLALQYGGSFPIHHNHLMFMMFPHLAKAERHEFSRLRSLAGIVDFFRERGWWAQNGPSAARAAGPSE